MSSNNFDAYIRGNVYRTTLRARESTIEGGNVQPAGPPGPEAPASGLVANEGIPPLEVAPDVPPPIAAPSPTTSSPAAEASPMSMEEMRNLRMRRFQQQGATASAPTPAPAVAQGATGPVDAQAPAAPLQQGGRPVSALTAMLRADVTPSPAPGNTTPAPASAPVPDAGPVPPAAIVTPATPIPATSGSGGAFGGESPSGVSPVGASPAALGASTPMMNASRAGTATASPAMARTPLSVTPGKPSPVGASSPAARSPDMKKEALPSVSLEEWESGIIRDVFLVSISEEDGFTYLPELADEAAMALSAGSETYPFCARDIDRILLMRIAHPGWELATADKHATLFHYLIDCFKRAWDISKKYGLDALQTDARASVLRSAMDLCVSYAGLVLRHSTLFRQHDSVAKDGARVLVGLFGARAGEKSLPAGFFEMLAARFENDGLDEIIGPMMDKMYWGMRGAQFPTSTPHIRTLQTITANKAVAAVMPLFDKWTVRGRNGRQVEEETFLGPFFHLSPTDELEAMRKVFPPDVLHSRQGCETALANMRRGHLMPQKEMLRSILLNVCKVAQGRVLDWVACVIQANAARTRIQTDYNSVSSDGFFGNLAYCMLKLCDPFTKSGAADKMNRIDATYLLLSPRPDSISETKLGVASSELPAWVDVRNRTAQEQWEQQERRIAAAAGTKADVVVPEAPSADWHFITEVFFMTMRVLHIGPMAAIPRYVQLREALADHISQVMTLPPGPRRDELQARIDLLDQRRRAWDIDLMDMSNSLFLIASWYRYFALWCVAAHKGQANAVPENKTAALPIKYLPEYVFVDLAEFLVFVQRTEATLYEQIDLQPIVSFLVLFACSPDTVKNPYLRAKFVSILTNWIPRERRVFNMSIRTFEDNDMARARLAGGLMEFYVDIEHTGSHTQFYDKFSVRHDIYCLLEYMWGIPYYHGAIIEQAQNPELFTRFVNMLLNDATFTLDESLGKLATLKGLLELRANPMEWSMLSDSDRQEKQVLEQQLKGAISSFMTLANESVHMLTFLSKAIIQPFMTEDLVGRVAAMLDGILAQLVGPRCTEVTVPNPEQYNFLPRQMVREVAEIYRSFRSEKAFQQAVALDERSYNHQLFVKLCTVCRREASIPELDIKNLEVFATEVQTIASNTKRLEDLLGDIPDEFIDPLMSTFMRDPVILPSSKLVVDRSTIARHLLSDPIDPFTRQPLTIEQVMPDDALRLRLEDFMRSKLSPADFAFHSSQKPR